LLTFGILRELLVKGEPAATHLIDMFA